MHPDPPGALPCPLLACPPCCPQNDKGIPVLGIAVGFNQREMVRLLLDRGADVAAADAKGSTALHYAAGARPWRAARGAAGL
jgi:ankyrin repeat protein